MSVDGRGLTCQMDTQKGAQDNFNRFRVEERNVIDTCGLKEISKGMICVKIKCQVEPL